MSIASALIIACNLLLAVCVYVLASTYRRANAMRLALVGSFLSIAVADLALTLRGDLDPARITTIIVLDALLILLAVMFVRNNRAHAAALDGQRQDALLRMEQQRSDRELALSDRNTELY